jgi:hypothetical protein
MADAVAARVEPLIAGRRPGRTSLAQWATTPWGALVLFALVAVAFRAVQFGNPIVHIDDQFYLLVGDRMWHGALPYVDIWDRKPIGLFLIYAAIRGLGGDGILQYQVVATLFAIATAGVIHRIAGRIAAPAGALAAGVLYLASLGMVGGDGGQAPVLYNLPVALAALAIVRVVERPAFDRRARIDAAAAMLLMGLAIQIKYTVLFEGAYFGLALMWLAHARKVPLPALVRMACLWALLGIGPTAVAWGAYAAVGQGDAFFFANFSSIFLRGQERASVTSGHLAAMAVRLVPLVGAAGLMLWRARRERGTPARAVRFVGGWATTSIGAVLVFGSYFDHYALPVLAPLVVAVAPVLGGPDRGRVRPIQAATMLFLLLYSSVLTIATVTNHRRNRGTGSEIAKMATFIRSRLAGCLFVYDGDPILYKLTNSCLPSRWAFPDHLNNSREDGAIGIDTLAETQRIMAARPRLIVTGSAPLPQTNRRTWDYMQAALRRDYREAGMWQVGTRYRVVYERLPGA